MRALASTYFHYTFQLYSGQSPLSSDLPRKYAILRTFSVLRDVCRVDSLAEANTIIDTQQ
jgi:hypothetical protein